MTTDLKAMSYTLDLLRDKLVEKAKLALDDPSEMKGIEELERTHNNLREEYRRRVFDHSLNYAYGLPQRGTI